MSLPLSFLLGLLTLFASVELDRPIPGSGSLDQVIVFAPILLLPTVLVMLAQRSAMARLVQGRRGRVPPRLWLRASLISVPLGMWLLLGPGGHADLADRVAAGSETVRLALLLLPLAIMEVPRIAAATVAGQWCEIDDELAGRSLVSMGMLPSLRDSWPLVRLRLGWVLLLAMPCFLFGAALDLLSLDRTAQGLVLITGFGSTAAMLVFMAVAAVVLPPWFRIAFAARPLPEPLGQRLRTTAAALGFPSSRLFLLPTGQRSLNAMMVGPLPIGRSLGITDGLVHALGEDALAGVVAHEVGHAKREHPALLVSLAVLVPMLLLGPVQLLEMHELPVTIQALIGLVVLSIAWTVVRGLAHRFEHEADVVSVQAFGAAPCTQALRTVLAMALPHKHGFFGRISSMHPDELIRYEVMWRYERDPAFRTRFDAAGRRIRWAVAGLLLASLAAASVTWLREWPYERAFLAFHRGDLVATGAAIAEVGETVPSHWQEAWQYLSADFAAAAEFAPQARDWSSVAATVVPQTWDKGVEVLLREGPAAARPWFSIAVGVAEDPPLVRRAVLDYCEAAAATDTDRMERVKLVVRRLGAPVELQRVFSG
ncbi:MAG: M48 family metalloprotease [Planctomycetes bacterium]|nr:M48 family metalloprotease [Planctomycetota bacterium]MCB9884386.1 M48 family metalloprotease [Planctomycetota bacterium]